MPPRRPTGPPPQTRSSSGNLASSSTLSTARRKTSDHSLSSKRSADRINKPSPSSSGRTAPQRRQEQPVTRTTSRPTSRQPSPQQLGQEAEHIQTEGTAYPGQGVIDLHSPTTLGPPQLPQQPPTVAQDMPAQQQMQFPPAQMASSISSAPNITITGPPTTHQAGSQPSGLPGTSLPNPLAIQQQQQLIAQNMAHPAITYGGMQHWPVTLPYLQSPPEQPRLSFKETNDGTFTHLKTNLTVRFAGVDPKYIDQIWKGTFDPKDLKHLSTGTLPSGIFESSLPASERQLRSIFMGFKVYSQIVKSLATPQLALDLTTAFDTYEQRLWENIACFTLESVEQYHKAFVHRAIRTRQDDPTVWQPDNDRSAQIFLRHRLSSTSGASSIPIEQQICFNYNKGTCTRGEKCSRQHRCRICKGSHPELSCHHSSQASSANATPLRERTNRA